MLLLVASAHAHDLVGPHTHDPATAAVFGLWIVAAIAFGVYSRRWITAGAR